MRSSLAAIGQSLRTARTERSLSLEQAAQDTRISIRFLEALEEEDFMALPAPVYVRGFLRSYANYLGIDPHPLLEQLRANEENAAARQRSADPFRPPVSIAHPLPLPVVADAADRDVAAYEGEYDEDWDQAAETDWGGGAEPGRSRSRVIGVLDEREGDGGGATRVAMIVAGVAVVIVLFLGVVLVLGGDDGKNALAPVTEPTATATLATGTVIEVGSPTLEGTTDAAGATGTAEAGAAGAETATPEGQEATATATPSGSNPTAAPAQATATATPSPTATATATATPPLPTPTPIPTPTVIPHPYEFNECIATNNECPSGSIVFCAPDGWFVDVPPYQSWPTEWPQTPFTTIAQARNTCP